MKSKNKKFKRILIIGGSKGIGNSVYKNIKSLSLETLALSRKDLDTSNPKSVNDFCTKYKNNESEFNLEEAVKSLEESLNTNSTFS